MSAYILPAGSWSPQRFNGMSTSIIVTLYERVTVPTGQTLGGVTALTCVVGMVTMPTANKAAIDSAPIRL